jgi:transposase
MPDTRPPYPQEFRSEAVRLVLEHGKPISAVARDLGVSAESIRAWICKEEIDSGHRGGLTTTEQEELQRLCRENRILREEREILRKTAAFFARETELTGSLWGRTPRPHEPNLKNTEPQASRD